MEDYPCLRFGASTPMQSVPQCKGTMMRVKTDHKGKQKFVCNQCLREAYNWSEKTDWDYGDRPQTPAE